MGLLRFLPLAGLAALCAAAPVALGSWRPSSGGLSRLTDSTNAVIETVTPTAGPPLSSLPEAVLGVDEAQEQEIRAAIAEAQREVSARSPIVEALLKAGTRPPAISRPAMALKPGLAGFLRHYEARREIHRSFMWKGVIGHIGLAIAAWLLSMTSCARFLAALSYHAAGLWLRFLSWTAPPAALLWRVNVWMSVPVEWLTVPLAALVAGALVLLLIDENAPVWNGTLGGCLWTLGSATAVVGLERLLV